MNQGSPLIVVVKKPRGRPKAADPLKPVTACLRESEFESVRKIAEKRNISISAVIRVFVVSRLRGGKNFPTD